MSVNWQLLHESVEHIGYRSISRRAYLLPDVRQANFDVFVEGNSVCTLALTPDRQVILVKQFRPGPNKVLLELPGGGIEPGEDPADAAARELLEETGFSGETHFVQESWHSGYSTLRRFNFVTLNCRKVEEPAGDGGDEFIETIVLPLIDFRRHLKTGELTDLGTAMAGLDYLAL